MTTRIIEEREIECVFFYSVAMVAILRCLLGFAADDKLICPAQPEAINEVHHDVNSDVDIAQFRFRPTWPSRKKFFS
jgi:hypothetical protein